MQEVLAHVRQSVLRQACDQVKHLLRRKLWIGGGLLQLGKQALAALVVAVYAFGASYLIAKLIDKVMGFRVSPEDESAGIDFAQHAETAYAEKLDKARQDREPVTVTETLSRDRP